MAIVKMKKLTVYAVGSQTDAIVRKLMKRKCLEIQQTPASEFEGLDVRRFRCDEQRTEYKRQVAEISAVLPVLHKHAVKKKGGLFHVRRTLDLDEFAKSEACAKAREAVEQSKGLIEKLTETRALISKTDTAIKALSVWEQYDLPLKFKGTKTVESALYSMPKPKDPEKVLNDLEQSGCCCEPINLDPSGLYFSCLWLRKDEEPVLKALASAGATRASFKDYSKTPSATLEQLRKDLNGLMDREALIIKNLGVYAELIPDIETLYDLCETNRLVLHHRYKMLCLSNCCILSCWMPEPNTDKVLSVLDAFDCAYETEDPEPEDTPPVLLKNNAFSKNYEYVVGMYAYPKYGSVDPTLVMSIFYFIIFGLMFADVGYGLFLTLGGFLGAKFLKPKEDTKKLLTMFGYCGISSVVCGVLFGGWFGDLPYAIMENILKIPDPQHAVPFFNGLVMNPLDSLTDFLIVAFAIGLIHMVSGMAIKFYSLCRNGEVFSAIFDIGSWWVVFAGLVLLVVNPMIGGIVAGVGVLMLIATQGREAKGIMKLLKGIMSLYDLVSYVSDLLSYSRILALALVAAVIGKVINLTTMMASNPAGFIVMILIMIVGHGLNLAINVLGSFVHTSRLQYIEFFGKFYEEGPRGYRPAQNSDRYTIEPAENTN
ncbi:MAG: V-type ATP synthase subunit I [Clostridia bacterium]|nr:V-type ATP synthase subunit I [Clostridia bacterium]